jgi:predicted ATPase
VWVVELAAVREPERVPSAVAALLGIPERPGVPVADSLTAALARQQLLLVLDNCEHVIEAVAELCGDLLMAADDVRVLATSREPVGVSGETRYRLPPLALPGPGDEAARHPPSSAFGLTPASPVRGTPGPSSRGSGSRAGSR